MSEIKVNSIKGVGASAAAITVNNTDGTGTANLSNRQNRNLIINGAFQVAQRGTSSTSNGYQTVDRFLIFYDNTDEAPTQEQADVAAGTSPYTSGFRKSFKITNGNQTGGAGTSDVIVFSTKLEAQDIANSGWNYTSSSSFITLSFWVKSSVAQTFYGQLVTDDGTKQNYPFETGSLTADTWTKVTKTIPGNSNLTFNNDTGEGMEMIFALFRGTDTTGSISLNAWAANNNSVRMPNNTSTWYTTNDSTFEITAIQLEVGSVATDFEHRSFEDEIRRCRRYFCKYVGPLNINFVNEHPNNTAGYLHFPFYEEMRASPTVTMGSSVNISRPQVSVSQKIQSAADIGPNCFNVIGWSGQGSLGSTGDAYYRMSLSEGDANSTISCSAEL